MSDSRMVNSSSLTTSRAAAAATVADDTVSLNDDVDGTTVLMTACQGEDCDTVKELLSTDQVAQITTVDQYNRTALHYCATNRQTFVVDLLLEHWRQTDSSHGPSILEMRDCDGLTALAHAVIAGNHTMIEHLLMMGADVTCRDDERHTVMHFATVHGHVELIKFLHVHGADVTMADQYGATPLHYAVQMCAQHQQQSTQPDENSCDMDTNRQDDIDRSIHLRVLQAVLSRTEIIDSFDQQLRTPLIWAATCGSSEACRELLSAGANTEAADVEGLTPLHCASSRGHVTCVDMLLTSSANANSVDHSGCTPIVYAITLGHAHSVTSLLHHGANPNHVDVKGRTPAHCAAVSGNVDMLRALRSEQGNLWLASQVTGNYPLHEAAIAGHIGSHNILSLSRLSQV